MAKIISLIINGDAVEFDSDTPDFSNLVATIVKNKDYDFSKIIVTCDDAAFDSETFKEAIIDVAKSIVNNLKINEDGYEKSMAPFSQSDNGHIDN